MSLEVSVSPKWYGQRTFSLILSGQDFVGMEKPRFHLKAIRAGSLTIAGAI